MLDLEAIKNDLEILLLQLGKIAKEAYLNKNKKFNVKSHENDLLTSTDVEINKLILNHLEKNYPQISVISEESEKITKDSKYAFVVDPIDGTKNFVRNIPIFYMGIGLVENNKTIFCITHNPISQETFWAVKGKGTFLNNEKIFVGDRKLNLSDVTIRTCSSKKLEKKVVSNMIERVHQVKNDFCSHHEISCVACNRFDGFVSKGSYSWDYCQYLLVEEAGGTVTDWEGNEYDISKDNIIVSNGIIHSELLNLVNEVE